MPCREGKDHVLPFELMEKEELSSDSKEDNAKPYVDESSSSTPLLNGLHSYSLAVLDQRLSPQRRSPFPFSGFPYGESFVDDDPVAFASLNYQPQSPHSQRPMLVVEGEPRKPRSTWSNQVELVLACIGYTIGLGNVWRFPYLCYKNGGGAFFVPYLIMLAVCGIPLLFMELAIGQYTRLGPIGALGKICPLFKGVGLAIVVISFLICTYYNVILAWTLFYLFNSIRGDLPWSKCQNKWNSDRCWDKYANHSDPTQPNDSKTPAQEFYDRKVLELTDGIDRPGDMRWDLVLALFVAWILIYFAIWKSIRSSGKVVYISATFPYAFLIAFLGRSLLLDGAPQGILFFLKPQWAQLLNVKIWVNAAAQNFSSIGVAFGTLIAYASYSKFHNNILRDALTIGFVDAFTSILSGLVIFATVGHVAHKHHKEISDVVAEGNYQGPGVIFVAYPEVMSHMPLPHIWATLFFCLLLLLGLDSQFATVEVVVTSLQDAFPNCIKRYLKCHEVLVLLVCLISFIYGLPYVTKGGIYVFQLVEYYTAAISLMYLAFFEVIAIVWFYGAGRLSLNIQEMTGRLPSLYMRLCWWVAAPVLILVVWAYSLIDYKPLMYNKIRYPDWAEGLGWGIAFVSIGCIPGYAIKALCGAQGHSLWEKLRSTIQSQLTNEGSENPGTSSYSLRMSGSRSSATIPPEEEPVTKPHHHTHEMVKVEQIISTV